LTVLSVCIHAFAQESEYSRMKQELNAYSLPLVNVTVDTAALNRVSFVDGEIELVDFQHRTDASSDTVRYLCKYRIRGGSAADYEKKSLAVKLIDEAGEDLDACILGIRPENSWILDAMAIDRIRMRNRLCFDIWNEMSRTPYDTKYKNRNGTEGVFVEVFINGSYNGIYCLTDKIDRKLLGLKKTKEEKGDTLIRGLLYKGTTWDSASDLLSYEKVEMDSDHWNAWELQYPNDNILNGVWNPLMQLIDFCSDSTADDTFSREYQNYFYTDNLADYVVFTAALNVCDNAYKNTFLSTPDINRGHRYLVTPWDMDMSLGGNWDGGYNEDLGSIVRYTEIAPFNQLMGGNVDGFNDELAAVWSRYYATLFSPSHIAKLVDHYADLFTASGAWEREVVRWGGNPVPLKKSVRDELEYVKSWYERNYTSLCDQFDITSSVDSISEVRHGTGTFMLDGRKVQEGTPLAKGIYIINGKKVCK